jgi:hypothetical protein
MTFLHKRVEEGDGTFGSHLRDLRELQQRTILQASRDTKISEGTIRAFEEDDMGALDDPVFAERHLRAYVWYLGGHEPYFLARYRERLAALTHTSVSKTSLVPRKLGVKWLDLFAGPQVAAVAGVALLGAAFGGYVLWQAHLVRIPPPLALERPVEGERLALPRVDVRGRTMPEAVVTVNGKEAPVDADGTFQLSLDVRRGTTLVTVVARRRRGSESRVDRTVVYDEALTNVSVPDIRVATSSATGTR